MIFPIAEGLDPPLRATHYRPCSESEEKRFYRHGAS